MNSLEKIGEPLKLQLNDCWAKTDECGQPALSVRDHCVNVGAVASLACGMLPESSRCLLPDGAVSLIAAHDIGKITPGFLMKCAAWRSKWQKVLGLDSLDVYEGNHAPTGQRFLAGVAELGNPPTNWLILHHGKVSQMRGTAWMNTVFGTSVLDDVEGMQTRWKPKPSGFVVLLSSQPSQTSEGTTLRFLDGTSHTFLPGRFDFDLARKLHCNACRVPKYLIADTLRSHTAPAWLAQHFLNSILATCPPDSAECEPCSSPPQIAYRLRYNPERGLWHERNTSVSVPWDEEESWF